MNTLDSGWLVKQIARVVDAPTSSRTVLTVGVSDEAARCYLKEVELHLSGTDRSFTPNNAEMIYRYFD